MIFFRARRKFGAPYLIQSSCHLGSYKMPSAAVNLTGSAAAASTRRRMPFPFRMMFVILSRSALACCVVLALSVLCEVSFFFFINSVLLSSAVESAFSKCAK